MGRGGFRDCGLSATIELKLEAALAKYFAAKTLNFRRLGNEYL
jgi:hypothetical protein